MLTSTWASFHLKIRIPSGSSTRKRSAKPWGISSRHSLVSTLYIARIQRATSARVRCGGSNTTKRKAASPRADSESPSAHLAQPSVSGCRIAGFRRRGCRRTGRAGLPCRTTSCGGHCMCRALQPLRSSRPPANQVGHVHQG